MLFLTMFLKDSNQVEMFLTNNEINPTSYAQYKHARTTAGIEITSSHDQVLVVCILVLEFFFKDSLYFKFAEFSFAKS